MAAKLDRPELLLMDASKRIADVSAQSEGYGTHSMRRTKASLSYKATGNLWAVQILLGHTNIENIV